MGSLYSLIKKSNMKLSSHNRAATQFRGATADKASEVPVVHTNIKDGKLSIQTTFGDSVKSQTTTGNAINPSSEGSGQV